MVQQYLLHFVSLILLHKSLSVIYTLNIFPLEPTKISAESHICLLFLLFKTPTELKVSLALSAHEAASASATIAAPSASQFVCDRYCRRFTVSILRLRSLQLACHIFPTLKHVCYCDKRVLHSCHNVCHLFTPYTSMKPGFVIRGQFNKKVTNPSCELRF
jgi:hypothetical protein